MCERLVLLRPVDLRVCGPRHFYRLIHKGRFAEWLSAERAQRDSGFRVFAVAACLAGGAQARAPLQVGAVTPELLDPGLQDATIALLQGANLGGATRVTVTWERGQTALDPGVLGRPSCRGRQGDTAGIDVHLDERCQNCEHAAGRLPRRF
jgi:hypothetical protein